jgi:hypothetical protein
VAERLPISQWTNCRRKLSGVNTESSNKYRRDAHTPEAVSHWYVYLICGRKHGVLPQERWVPERHTWQESCISLGNAEMVVDGSIGYYLEPYHTSI